MNLTSLIVKTTSGLSDESYLIYNGEDLRVPQVKLFLDEKGLDESYLIDSGEDFRISQVKLFLDQEGLDESEDLTRRH